MEYMTGHVFHGSTLEYNQRQYSKENSYLCTSLTWSKQAWMQNNRTAKVDMFDVCVQREAKD